MSKYKYGDLGKSYAYQRCKKCYKLLIDQGLEQEVCGAKYCARCVCQIYQPYYLSKQPVNIVEMYCGHFIQKPTLTFFIQNYCINCGFAINDATDIEMLDGVKLCRRCFNFQEEKYQDCLIECMSCNRIIRTRGFLADTEITMCKDCAKAQTTMHSSIIQSRISVDNEVKQSSRTKEKQKIEQEQQPSEELSIVSRFSALQQEEKEEDNKKQHKLKLSSKHSVEIRVQNFKIQIKRKEDPLLECSVCNSYLNKDAIISEKGSETICRACFMNTNSQRDVGFYSSFLKNNIEENQRLKHVSAPKNKPQLTSTVQPKTKVLKYSQIFEQSKLVKELKQKYSIPTASAKKYTPEPWQQKQIQKSKLCEICGKKGYNIIRVDKKKSCLECYNK